MPVHDRITSDYFSQQMRDDMIAARDAIIGNPDDITPRLTEKHGATTIRSGGIALERAGATPVQEGTRCYTIANSLQVQIKSFSPAKDSKIQDAFDENNLIRKNLTRVSCEKNSSLMALDVNCFQAASAMAMESMKLAPTAIQNVLKEYSDMLNIPNMGVDGNYAYGTLQTNVAVPVRHGSSE